MIILIVTLTITIITLIALLVLLITSPLSFPRLSRLSLPPRPPADLLPADPPSADSHRIPVHHASLPATLNSMNERYDIQPGTSGTWFVIDTANNNTPVHEYATHRAALMAAIRMDRR